MCLLLPGLSCPPKNYFQNLNTMGSGVDFINILQAAFACADPESEKNSVKSSVSFHAFGIFSHKSCLWKVDEIDTR